MSKEYNDLKPLCIDLYSGLHGWAEAFVANGWRVKAIDLYDMHKECGMPYERPPEIELILRDVRSLHGSQFADAACIVASPPCQAYSYRAMPWKRAKALPPPDNTLFNECFRIQREACEAAGHHIPLVVENVRGAEKWVGPARWHFGSFYLWGDVPPLMPPTSRRPMKVGVAHRSNGETNFHGSAARAAGVKVSGIGPSGSFGKGFQQEAAPAYREGMKNQDGGSWFGLNPNGTPGALNNARDGRKVAGIKLSEVDFNVAAAQRYRISQQALDEGNKGNWLDWDRTTGKRVCKGQRATSSRSNSRKAASAHIAKIPFPLADWIAKTYLPVKESVYA